MARVVQRRTGPTYLILTVVFVFLFVIAAVFAVVFFQEAQKYKKAEATLKDFLDPVIGDIYVATSKQDGSVDYSIRYESQPVQVYAKEFMASYADRKTKTSGAAKPNMLADLLRDRQVLLNVLFPSDNVSVEQALKAVNNYYSDPTREKALTLCNVDKSTVNAIPRQSIFSEAKIAYQTAITAQEQTAAMVVERDKFRDQVETEKKSIDGVKETVKTQISDWEKKYNDVLARADQDQKNYSQDLEKIKAEHKSQCDKFDRDISDLNNDNTELRRIKSKLENDLKAEKIKNQEIRRSLVPEQELQVGINGKIVRVPENSDVCFIDIGSDDKIKPGMTFSVYAGRIPRKSDLVTKDKSPEQVEREWDEFLKEKCKGKLVVVDTDRRYSECRIVDQKRGNPIIAGDVITNPIVDPIKSFTFVIKGDFDLFNSGKASRSSEERKRKVDLIKKFIIACGGRVSDDLDSNVDYVILGDSPETLGPVAPEDDDRVKAVKEQALKDLKDYNDTRDQAFKSGFPILNTNRFLILTGYVPAKQD